MTSVGVCVCYVRVNNLFLHFNCAVLLCGFLGFAVEYFSLLTVLCACVCLNACVYVLFCSFFHHQQMLIIKGHLSGFSNGS